MLNTNAEFEGAPSPLKDGIVASVKLDFPGFAGVPTTYIVASQARSGSHLLCQLLYGTGLAGRPLEYFHPRHWASWRKRCGDKNALFAASMLLRRRTSPNGCFGVKMHWPHFVSMLKLGVESHFRTAKFVYLTRRDVLGQAISYVIALQTGQWVSDQLRQKDPVYSYDAIERAVRTILAQRRNWEAFFCASGVPRMHVTYESLLESREADIKKILGFIGVDDVAQVPELLLGAPSIQRTDLNEVWRRRFLAAASTKYDERRVWRMLVREHASD